MVLLILQEKHRGVNLPLQGKNLVSVWWEKWGLSKDQLLIHAFVNCFMFQSRLCSCQIHPSRESPMFICHMFTLCSLYTYSLILSMLSCLQFASLYGYIATLCIIPIIYNSTYLTPPLLRKMMLEDDTEFVHLPT